MNNLETLQQQHKEMGIEIERLQREGEDPRVMPDDYYLVDEDGLTFQTRSVISTNAAQRRFNFGNTFETKELAEKHAKRLKVFNLLWDYARIFNKDNSTYAGALICYSESKGVHSSKSTSITDGMPVFNKVEHAERAIKLIGEDVIKDAWA